MSPRLTDGLVHEIRACLISDPNSSQAFSDKFLQIVCDEHGLKRENLDAVYPCTAVQAGMLSQSIRYQGKLYYNHVVFKLSSSTNLSKLRKAWEYVFRAHEILRAGFFEVDDGQHTFAMAIHKPQAVTLPWSLVDAIGDDLEELLTEHKSLHASEAVRDLGVPPWQLTVFKSSDAHVLLSAHHAIYDAQSLQSILDDVILHYISGAERQRPHFGSVLKAILKSTSEPSLLEAERTFWSRQLEGASITKFPSLTVTRVASIASHITTLASSWKLSEIERYSKKHGFSVNGLAQAAWAKLLSAYTGEIQVMFGMGTSSIFIY